MHALVGRLSFDQQKLEENIQTFIDYILGLKPVAVKGTYLKSAAISATMSPGIPIAA